MRFEYLREISKKDVESLSSTLCFIGNPIDDRGHFITSALGSELHNNVIRIELKAEDMRSEINHTNVSYRNISDHLSTLTNSLSFENVLLDATTLGVPELLIIMKWLQLLDTCERVKIIYAEPDEYPRIQLPSVYGNHQFNLSNASIGYKSLPGFTKTASTEKKSHLIALLGFERVRLGQLLQNDEGAYIDEITPVFGVPGFKPSYDKHSAYQNVDSIKDKEKSNKPLFASANNPYDTFMLLERVRETETDRVINVAPIGTKPMAIGAAIFILKHRQENVGLMYDYPIKTAGRSKGVSKIHIYAVRFK